ncbi:MAG: hypothetical protein AABW88_03045 [Nanoarchaeota archaeon]
MQEGLELVLRKSAVKPLFNVKSEPLAEEEQNLIKNAGFLVAHLCDRRDSKLRPAVQYAISLGIPIYVLQKTGCYEPPGTFNKAKTIVRTAEPFEYQTKAGLKYQIRRLTSELSAPRTRRILLI